VQVPDRAELGRFYRDHLERVVLPFWLPATIDHDRGGVFNCVDHVTGRRVSRDKFVWSQARWAWTMAHAARMARRGLIDWPEDELLGTARRTADFLLRHAFLADGEVADGGPADGATAYLLADDGTRKEFAPGKGHDLSFYGDGFVILALTGVARATDDDALLERALATYDGVRRRLAAGRVRSEPYPLPLGCRAHGWPMIMLNVAQELERALDVARHPRAPSVAADALGYMDQVLRDFVRPDGLVQEVICADARPGLLTGHVTPGHAIESMWFVLEQALRHGRADAAATAQRVLLASFRDGWDAEFGGILRYTLLPGVSMPARGDGPFEQLIVDTWDTKIWWPHSEALYGALLAEMAGGGAAFADVHDQVFRYAFATFPNPDARVGEWIHIRDRAGVPIDKVVGLPVKDPYHLTRNLLFLIELLAEGVESRTSAA
jgi:N-acylglucosamine 2-epimerase